MDGAWLGVDLGTQGVRALLAGLDGRVHGRGAVPLTGRRAGDRHEQRPEDWWDGVRGAVRAALRGFPAAAVRGVAVCGTSGTVLLADPDGRPLTAGLMYDDGRARAEAAGAGVPPSWGLPKLLWLVREHGRPGARLAHQADVVTGRLVGGPVPADSGHALKSGYDPVREEWPAGSFGLDPALLPEVVRPGTVLGGVCRAAAAETGLPAGVPVVAGTTDGCAAQLGSGALREGSWNSVLGTTLVLKGVTAGPVRDPGGALYCHRSPDGCWLPGGASGVGAGALPAGGDLAALDRLAARREPATAVAYPLVSRGERFPFLAPDATGFMLGAPADDADRHAALLQGVAFTERLALARVRWLGLPVEGPLTFTGGAARSAYWNRLRADVLGRPAWVPERAGAALGMAVLAASGTGHGTLADTAAAMAGPRTLVEPRPGGPERFAEPYRRLLDELERRGWLDAELASYARGERP